MTRGEKITGDGGARLARRNTSGTLTPVPNQPATPGRSVRLSDELWQGAQEIADEDGTDRSRVIRDALERYISYRRKQRRRQQP